MFIIQISVDHAPFVRMKGMGRIESRNQANITRKRLEFQSKYIGSDRRYRVVRD